MQKISASILMGSDSDLKIMSAAAKIFEEFGVSYSMTIASAHRTPELLKDYIDEMLSAGCKVFIAGAGVAAHLPGVVASMVTVPVIGVPLKSEALLGMDALYSIVQMPPGIPVATVAVNNAKNAGLLAVQILSVCDDILAEKMIDYRRSMKEELEKKAKRLREVGYNEY